MKKALVLGALAGQADAIEALRSRGVETHACGHVKDGPGTEAADFFHLADIMNVQQIVSLAREIDADLVYSVGSDIAMPTVTQVCEELGLPYFHGSALTDVLRKKERLRAELKSSEVSPVEYDVVDSGEVLPPWKIFPCIVKPVDAQGQRGISIVRDTAELEDAIVLARGESISGPVIVEEFLEGPEVSAHVIVEDGKVIFFLPSDRHLWAGGMVGVPSAHSLPLGPRTGESTDQILDLVQAAVAALHVMEGPLYVQAILTQEGPRIVEIASRLDGCHLWRLVKLSTGIDIMDAVLGRLLGEPWPKFPEVVKAAPMTLRFLLDSPETVASDAYIKGVTDPNAIFTEVQVAEGMKPRKTNDVVSRIGYEIVGGV